jgi:hypothetical protein
MTHINNFRPRSKRSQITASIYDSGRDGIIFQGSNSTINRKALGNASQINDHAAAESNAVFIVENDVAPAAATAKPRVNSRKIIPFHELPRHRDVENAIAFTRKLLRGLQNAPCPWMNFDRPMRSVAIHSRDIAGRIVKTHQPVHFFDRGKGAIDIVRRSLARNLNKRAE